jgi:hypothetical protein
MSRDRQCFPPIVWHISIQCRIYHLLAWLRPMRTRKECVESGTHKLLLISQIHMFSEGFSPLCIFFAVVLNYLRILTIKNGIDEPGRPRRLDCLHIIDPQQQGDCQTHPCWPGSSSRRTSSSSRPHANPPSDGPPTKVTPQIKQAVIEPTPQNSNFADLQTAQIISERFAIPIARATIN